MTAGRESQMEGSGSKEGLSPRIRPGKLALSDKLIAFIFYKNSVLLIFIMLYLLFFMKKI
jgi:hypothetical protein